jgi:hypothetical protein
MFKDNDPSFKVVVTIDIVPAGVPVPHIIDHKIMPVAHVVVDCTALDVGIAFADRGMERPRRGRRA